MKIKTLLSLLICCLFSLNGFSQEIELDPSKGWQGRLMDVGISGNNTNFSSASATCGPLEANKILFHQGMTIFSPIDLQIESDVQLYTVVDIANTAPVGLYDVILWAGQGSGCEVSCQDCFEVLPRSSIVSVSPDEENINTSNIDVTITTDYSCFTQGSSTCQVNAGNVRFFQAPPNTFDFQPNTVTIVDDKTLVANIDLPNFVIVDDYSIVVAEGYPCEASCEDCFEVLADPFLELITGNAGVRGQDTTIVLEIFFADITNCAYGATTVYLQLGSYTIIPDAVMVNGQMIDITITIPADAPLGDYDIIVGDQLGGDCEYICEGCFRIDQGVSTSTPVYEDDLLVLPNPNSGAFILSSEIPLFDVCLEIYDAAGRQVHYEKMEMFNTQKIDLPVQGVYLVKLATQDAIRIQRVVVN